MRSRESNSDPPKRELLAAHAKGRLDPELASALEESPELLPTLANHLLEAHFPHSIHEDILSAVGLAVDGYTTSRRRRDPKFRERMMIAYERRCAVCNFDVRIGSVSIGLEAAHIRWHQAGGPDEETNGLALCSTHHKTFDLGAFTVDPTDGLLVSEQVTGSSELDHILLRHHGQPVREPQHKEHRPAPGFLAWHRRQVFKERPRS
jgi:putative restriction endonuclease